MADVGWAINLLRVLASDGLSMMKPWLVIMWLMAASKVSLHSARKVKSLVVYALAVLCPGQSG